ANDEEDGEISAHDGQNGRRHGEDVEAVSPGKRNHWNWLEMNGVEWGSPGGALVSDRGGGRLSASRGVPPRGYRVLQCYTHWPACTKAGSRVLHRCYIFQTPRAELQSMRLRGHGCGSVRNCKKV